MGRWSGELFHFGTLCWPSPPLTLLFGKDTGRRQWSMGTGPTRYFWMTCLFIFCAYFTSYLDVYMDKNSDDYTCRTEADPIHVPSSLI